MPKALKVSRLTIIRRSFVWSQTSFFLQAKLDELGFLVLMDPSLAAYLANDVPIGLVTVRIIYAVENTIDTVTCRISSKRATTLGIALK